MDLYALGLELTILMAFWLCLGVLHRGPSSTGRGTFAALCLSGVLWCAGELVAVRSLLSEPVADRIRYAGILSLPAFWLGLAGHANRLDLARRVPWFPLVLLAPSACLYGLLFTPSWSGLFMQTVPGGVDRYGPLWWAALTYGYVMMLAGTALFVWGAARRTGLGHWSWRLAVGLAALVPLAGNAAYIASRHSFPVDPTPLLFGVALVALRGAIFSGGLLQALPISQHDLIEQLPLGVILTDRRGVVIDVNPAAARRLGTPPAQALGRTLDAILSEAHGDVQAEIAPVFARGREAGQLVLIDPPGKAAAS